MPWGGSFATRMRRLFLDGFSVMDVAEPLVSFDVETDALYVRRFMEKRDFDLVGVRRDGLVMEYVRCEELDEGVCGDYSHPFDSNDDLVPETATLIDVVHSLAINKQCFVTILDRVSAIVTLSDLEKPPMRMFLFGLITMVEMFMMTVIRRKYEDETWRERLSDARVRKAEELLEERKRLKQDVDLLDCLQLADKGRILLYDKAFIEALGLGSRRATRKALKELEHLRNNLAHTQAIIPTGWERIVVFCSRLEAMLRDHMADDHHLLPFRV